MVSMRCGASVIGPGAVVMSCSRLVDVFVGANALLEVRRRRFASRFGERLEMRGVLVLLVFLIDVCDICHAFVPFETENRNVRA